MGQMGSAAACHAQTATYGAEACADGVVGAGYTESLTPTGDHYLRQISLSIVKYKEYKQEDP